MKIPPQFRTIACILFILCASKQLRADPAPPKSFCDIPWGTSIDEAKRILGQKNDMRLSKETSTKLIYVGGSFAAIPAERWELDFLESGFYRGSVCLTMSIGTAIDGTEMRAYQFEDLAGLLTSKYGKGKRENSKDASDSDKSTSENRPGTVKEEWTFPNKNEDHGITILLNYHWMEPRQFYIQYTLTRPHQQTNPPGASSNDI